MAMPITTPPVVASVADAALNANNAGNTAASTKIDLAGVSGYAWSISGITFSYESAPTSGSIRVIEGNATGDFGAGNGVVKYGPLPITAAGIGPINISPAIQFTSGRAVRVELAAAGVAGYLTVNAWSRA